MIRTVIYLSIFGIILLGIATGILVVLNRNQDVITKVIGGLLIGTTTIFVTIFFSLHETKVEKSFTTSIVIDEEEHLPVLIIAPDSNQKVNERLSVLSSLSRPYTGSKADTRLIVKKPENFDQTFTFLQELFQYKFVRDMSDIQRVKSRVVSNNIGTGIRTQATINMPYKPDDLDKFEGNKVLEVFSTNQFSKGQMEIFRWKNGYLPLPKGTMLSVQHIPSSERTGVEKHKLFLTKANFFSVDITIESLSGAGLGALPNGLVIDSELAKRYRTYHFIITMKATFDKITSRNPKSDQYKKWVEWIFSELEKANTDAF